MASTLGALLAERGVLLFLLGLLTGLGQGIYRNPRVGLSAHMTGVQSGTVLIAFGLLWPHLGIAAGWAAPVAHALWLSFYAIWLALVLAAFFGASKVLPIAGKGFTAKPWQEALGGDGDGHGLAGLHSGRGGRFDPRAMAIDGLTRRADI